MKRIIPALVVLFLAVAVQWACNKGTKLSSETASESKEARLYFEKNSLYAEKNAAKYYLSPQWENSKLTTYNEETRFLIVPVKTGETKVLKEGMRFSRYAVFTFLKEEVIAGRIIEVIGQKAFVDKNIESIVKRRYLERIEGFTGKIIDYDINYSFRYGGLEYKNGELDKTAGIRMVSGNNLSLKDNSDARVVSTQALQSSEGWCLTTYIITTYPNGYQTYEIIDVDCVFYNDDPPPGSGGGPGADEGTSGSNVPGDLLCRGSLHFQQPSDNSMWTTNLIGLKIEDGVLVNQFNAYVHLPNGITDDAMFTPIVNPALPVPSGTTPAQYIASDPYFMTLFSSHDIEIRYDNEGAKWHFTEYAAKYITTWALNLAGASVAMIPGAADPYNQEAQRMVRDRAQALIKCVMPGAVVRKALGTTTNSYVLYSPACGNVGN